MADYGWLGDLNENFINIANIVEIFFNLDSQGELNFIVANTNDNTHFNLFDLPHVGDIVSTPDGNVTMTLEDAVKLVQSTAEILESKELITNDQFKDDMLEALGKF